jgi:hypothetical protein
VQDVAGHSEGAHHGYRQHHGHAEQVDMVVDKVKGLIPDGPPPADGR